MKKDGCPGSVGVCGVWESCPQGGQIGSGRQETACPLAGISARGVKQYHFQVALAVLVVTGKI